MGHRLEVATAGAPMCGHAGVASPCPPACPAGSGANEGQPLDRSGAGHAGPGRWWVGVAKQDSPDSPVNGPSPRGTLTPGGQAFA